MILKNYVTLRLYFIRGMSSGCKSGESLIILYKSGGEAVMKSFCEFIFVIVPWLILSLLIIIYDDFIVWHFFKFMVYISDVF